jgi:hypothetical protein
MTGLWPKVKLMKVFAQKSLPYPADMDLSSVWPSLLVCDQGHEDQVEPTERYFQMGYRLFEAVMSRCNADGSISEAKKAEDDVQLIVSEVNSCENPEAVKLQAIGLWFEFRRAN